MATCGKPLALEFSHRLRSLSSSNRATRGVSNSLLLPYHDRFQQFEERGPAFFGAVAQFGGDDAFVGDDHVGAALCLGELYGHALIGDRFARAR